MAATEIETMKNLSGRTLGHYRIVEQIGAGGMGVVYRAHDERLDRDVAIKALPEGVAGDPDRLSRFEREARAVAQLDHPNILAIHDFGSEDGTVYAVMELLDGESLRQVIAKGGLTSGKAVEYARAIVDGLAAAHDKGIIHRDLKPENVFLTRDGRIKILDFGLARIKQMVDHEAETVTFSPEGTAVGTVLGTVGYMSPEQAEGRPVDALSDLFSLGVVLYEMLTGRRPFMGDTAAATLAALLRDDPPPMTGVDPKLARLVERSLRKNASERFQSAADLRSAIDDCVAPSGDRESASIAVLPFHNMSGAAEDEYLCEGLTEEIINVLTRIPGLRVIARTSVFAVGRMGLDVREIGARLDVGTILEGSVRRSGQRVRITAQLVSSGDGGHLWSERFDRELTDVFALEDEIAEAIAERLRVGLNREDGASRRPAVDAEAHNAFLEGRYHLARGTPQALAQAMACFERAIARDPGFALAFDSLAEVYWYLGFFGGLLPRDAFSQGTWHALRALELDDTLAETHALLAMLRKELDYNWAEVDHELRRARELNRESPIVRLRYAISGLLPHGRIDAGVEEIEGVLQSDPLSIVVRWWLAIMLYLARRPDRMIDEGHRMIALDPNHFLGHWVVGVACSERDRARRRGGSASSGRTSCRVGSPSPSGSWPTGWGGRGGRTTRAGCWLKQRLWRRTVTCPRSPSPSATLVLATGMQAFEWWNRAIDVRDPLIVPIKNLPIFDPVRNDPRYPPMLRRMNLAED